jgi:endonuclease/exonuclease/phosphatase family metal-dependent hydrolase
MQKIFFFILFLFLTASGYSQKSMKVVTFNIRYSTHRDGVNAWSNRKAEVMALLKFHRADVFCVQEALHSQMVDLKKGMEDFDYTGVGRKNGKKKGEYSAVFYNSKRVKLIDSGTFWLSENPDKPGKGWDAACERICSWGKFEDLINGGEFFVFNTHFDHRGDIAREESAKLIAEKIQALGGDGLPVVLTGDFNLTPEKEAISVIKSNLNDSYEVSVEPPYGPVGTFSKFNWNHPIDKRIDYIFVNEHVTVQRYAVLTDSKNNRYPSDHMPVFTELIFK